MSNQKVIVLRPPSTSTRGRPQLKAVRRARTIQRAATRNRSIQR